MSLRSLLATTTLAFLAIKAAADCQLNNIIGSVSMPAMPPQLCQTQGAGYYTFSMDVSDVGGPSFSSGGSLAGSVGDQVFLIYDESCNLKGVYSPHQTNDCGTPYVIEDNFLKYVVTVTDVNFSVKHPYFSFLYADGKFSIRNNHCGCSGIDGGHAEQGCKCAFPVDGYPELTGVSPKGARFRAF